MLRHDVSDSNKDVVSNAGNSPDLRRRHVVLELAEPVLDRIRLRIVRHCVEDRVAGAGDQVTHGHVPVSACIVHEEQIAPQSVPSDHLGEKGYEALRVARTLIVQLPAQQACAGDGCDECVLGEDSVVRSPLYAMIPQVAPCCRLCT